MSDKMSLEEQIKALLTRRHGVNESLELLARELTETISSSVGTHLAVTELQMQFRDLYDLVTKLKKEFIAHTKEIAE